MKQYEVEIMGKYSHGRYGKERYFGMILSADSCKNAESFAEDIIFEMTFEEFFERCNQEYSDLAKKQFMCFKTFVLIGNNELKYMEKQYSLKDKIAERVEDKFSFKARVFRG